MIISRLTNDVEAIDQLVTDGVTSLVQNSLTLIGTAILLFVLDWRLALATLAVIPLMSIATVIFRVRSTRAYRAVRERLGLVTATLAEDIAGMRVVQAFTREGTNTRNFKAVTERYRDSNMETVVLNALYFPFVDLLSSIALAVVLGYGGHLYFNGDVTLGTLFAFMLYVQNFFDPVQQLSQLYNTFLSATAALDKIMDVMEEEPEVLDRPDAQPSADGGRQRDLRRSPLRVRQRPRGVARARPASPCRHDRRARRAHGRRQVHDRQAARAFLRPARRAGSRSTAMTCAT